MSIQPRYRPFVRRHIHGRHRALWCDRAVNDATPEHVAAEGATVIRRRSLESENGSIARHSAPAPARQRANRYCGRSVCEDSPLRRLPRRACRLVGRGASPPPAPPTERRQIVFRSTSGHHTAVQIGGTAVILDDCTFEVQQFRCRQPGIWSCRRKHRGDPHCAPHCTSGRAATLALRRLPFGGAPAASRRSSERLPS